MSDAGTDDGREYADRGVRVRCHGGESNVRGRRPARRRLHAGCEFTAEQQPATADLSSDEHCGQQRLGERKDDQRDVEWLLAADGV